jgi:ABC-type transport system involved in multi-copper enzyme maturation permease subunit
MSNPVLGRELIGLLRTRQAFLAQVGLALLFALLVLLRWPTDARVDLAGSQSRQVFRLFGYGLLTTLILLIPAFPATTIVREKQRGTLALLLNTPLRPWSIYFGKLAAVAGFAGLLLALSIPAATACFVMGGISLTGEVAVLYGVLFLVAVQYSALGLLVSSCAHSADSALRITYGLVLTLSVITLGPHLFFQGMPGILPVIAAWLRSLSPLPAVMEVLGHGDVGGQGLISAAGAPFQYGLLALTTTAGFALVTISRLNYTQFDRARSAGTITDERGLGLQLLRRLMFIVDPQRRTGSIGRFTNPILVKEFRCRRFGRSHWMLRLVAGSALLSLGLTYAATLGTLDWGPETIGGIMVLLQVALIILLTPSLAAGLISSERESGGWQLLQMTPLSTGVILRGKLLSVVWTMFLILCATLPGYVVMIYIRPALSAQIQQVLICLLLTAVFALFLSAAVSSLFRRTAPATTTSYVLLLGLCAGTMLAWMGRGAPFGHRTVEAVLTINPVAAALSVIKAPGFEAYALLPHNWWFLGAATACSMLVLGVQTWRLTRPQ